MKIPNIKNFIYEEFFSKEEFDNGENIPISWIVNRLDSKIPILAQAIRDRFKKIVIINDWALREWPKYFYSGVRPFNCHIGAKFSRHKLGLAMDVKIKGVKAPELRKDIKDNFKFYSKYGLTTIEAGTPTWTHLSVEDTGWRDAHGLWIL